MKYTSTLDLETMSTLEQMAKNWGVSKSEALRRAIHSAVAGVPDSRAEAASALHSGAVLATANQNDFQRFAGAGLKIAAV